MTQRSKIWGAAPKPAAQLNDRILDPESSDRRLRGNDGGVGKFSVIPAQAGIQSFGSNVQVGLSVVFITACAERFWFRALRASHFCHCHKSNQKV